MYYTVPTYIHTYIHTYIWMWLLDRWRLPTTWHSKSFFDSFCYSLVREISSHTGSHSTTFVIPATSTTISLVITRHWTKTPTTFCARYLDAAVPETLPSSFPPRISTVETESRGNYCGNSTATFRRIFSFVCCDSTSEIMNFSVTKFPT